MNNAVEHGELFENIQSKIRSLKSAQVITSRDEKFFSEHSKGVLSVDELKECIHISNNLNKNFKQNIEFFYQENTTEDRKKERLNEELARFTKSPSIIPPSVKQEVNRYLSGNTTYQNMSETIDRIYELRTKGISEVLNLYYERDRFITDNKEIYNRNIDNLLTVVASASERELQAIQNFSEGKISREEAKAELKNYASRVIESVANNYSGEETKAKIAYAETIKPLEENRTSINEPKPAPLNTNNSSFKISM